MVCSLVGGPPGAIASAGPLILGTRWGGRAEGRALYLAPIYGSTLGNQSYPIPLSFSVLLLANESCCFSPSHFPWISPSPLRLLNLLSDAAQTCCPLFTASTVPSGSQGASPHLSSASLAQAGWSVSTGPQRGTHVQRYVKALGKAGAVRVGLVGEGDDGRCCPRVKEGWKRQAVHLLITSSSKLR